MIDAGAAKRLSRSFRAFIPMVVSSAQNDAKLNGPCKVLAADCLDLEQSLNSRSVDQLWGEAHVVMIPVPELRSACGAGDGPAGAEVGGEVSERLAARIDRVGIATQVFGPVMGDWGDEQLPTNAMP